MPKLLHIQSSPRGDRSASTTVAREFLAAYQAKNPGDTVETLDLWKTDLPPFDKEAVDAKFAAMHGENPSGPPAQAWAAVVRVVDHFKSADKFLFSLPMWNFTIPYVLKHYIDVLAQPGLTVGFSPEKGYWGLITGRPTVAIYARGGTYAPGTPAAAYDHQSTYLKLVLGLMGMTDMKEIFLEGTGTSKEGVETGKKRAAELAAAF